MCHYYYLLPFAPVSPPGMNRFTYLTVIYESDRSARVIVRAFAKNPALEFVSFILNSGCGQEVTANFFAYNLESNNTFYTDSNALEI